MDLPIRTERLSLRPFAESDFADLHRLFSDPEVVRYLPWGPHDLEQSRSRLDDRLRRTSLAGGGDILSLVIEERATGSYVGEVMIVYGDEEQRTAQIGYLVGPRFAGRGYATEAARALLELAFGELAFSRVTAGLDARNAASARVLEKLGMRREAHHVEADLVDGEWVDSLRYAILASEYAADG